MEQVNVLWLGFAVPDEIAKELFKLDPLPAIQTHKFGWSFARALRCAFGEVTLASVCPVQSYPLVDRLIFRGENFSSRGMDGVLLGFVNVIVLKHLSRFIACLTTVSLLLRRRRIEWIFIHGLHTPYLIFGLISRLFGRRLAIVLTDPPGVLLPTDGKVARWLKKFDAFLVRRMLAYADVVIALAPDLARCLAPGRPALVFPGILQSNLIEASLALGSRAINKSNSEPFTIVYAGGLSAAYGVDRLVKAVCRFDAGIPVLLKLFGRGDQEDVIRQIAVSDPRIRYGGFVDEEALLPELCSADLLINPRPTSEFFASLSFPSKLIEYIATGRPVLTTRISSIPEDLKNHYYFISDESVEGIREAILKVMQLPASEIFSKGASAQKFAGDFLSEKALGEKILNFIKHF